MEPNLCSNCGESIYEYHDYNVMLDAEGEFEGYLCDECYEHPDREPFEFPEGVTD
jgi:hypothetical protein